MFEEPLPVSNAPPSGNPSGAQHPFPQRLHSTGAPPPTPSSMLHARCNSDLVVVNYPNLLSKFGICHHEETMYSFVQALHSDKDAMTPIWAGELYHSRYDASCLAAEVRLGLQSATLPPSEISAHHAHTIAVRNEYIDKVAWVWALELAADPSSHQTLDLPVQANTNRCFSPRSRHIFKPLPLAMLLSTFIWLPQLATLCGILPKVASLASPGTLVVAWSITSPWLTSSTSLCPHPIPTWKMC
ncbi:hypothetical protein DSO57_1039828 [Entomophthora muscae]|uniref:Uncharacterized protein n=1 Tax=Entomophthora muscae TaxID=34485 RepID=A0ACC2RIS7_9FUNG|nr:hypothetical protein DSO57_1039828 [Entomophthora muscae]